MKAAKELAKSHEFRDEEKIDLQRKPDPKFFIDA